MQYILIPLGGLGMRFKKLNYLKPKALIKANNKCIIYWLLDNLKINNTHIILIPYNKQEYHSYNLENKLKERYPNIKFKFFPLNKNTRGAAETINICLHRYINTETKQSDKYNDAPILCIDSDNFYLNDILSEWGGENKIFVFKDEGKLEEFSYVNVNNNLITKIVEKKKISNIACCGAYGFKSIYSLYNYSTKIIENSIYQKKEFYTSGIIQHMIDDNSQFKMNIILPKNYFTLGTPNNLRKFETIFLLDLDGTLVSSDDIYIKVWNQLLIEFNLKATDTFFNFFIKGKSDEQFLKYIFPNITDDIINNISIRKDQLFSQMITKQILFEGVLDFLEKIKNSYIAIVTSSNTFAATSILKKTGINNYVNLLIASENCTQHKPHAEPYNNAIKTLGINPKNIIIFEDSYSGFASAKQITQNIFVKITNIDVDFGHIKFNNYADIKNVYKISLTQDKIIFSDIYKLLPIKKILKSPTNLKTGYICNIDLYELIYIDNFKDSVVLKLNNENNALADTAKKLNMYQNEIKFYRDISNIINVNIPKCYNIINTHTDQGIVLENLLKYKGQFGWNLNTSIEKTFLVINNICNMHTRFRFNNSNDIITSMENLKKVNEITHYYNLINERYPIFRKNMKHLLSKESLKIFDKIKENFKIIGDKLSIFPLNFCHGDYKSANIFYKNNGTIITLDWQYIHLGKGVSDLVFLLVESIDFDKKICVTLKNLYYTMYSEKYPTYQIDEYENEFNLSLCMFPFFVCVWFNSENLDKLIDSTFPLRFLRNIEKYYEYFLTDYDFDKILT